MLVITNYSTEYLNQIEKWNIKFSKMPLKSALWIFFSLEVKSRGVDLLRSLVNVYLTMQGY